MPDIVGMVFIQIVFAIAGVMLITAAISYYLYKDVKFARWIGIPGAALMLLALMVNACR